MPFELVEEPVKEKKRFEVVEEPPVGPPQETPRFVMEEGAPQPSLEEFGIRTDVSPAKQVTDYLLGKSPTQLSYQSAVEKKPQERILAPLRGWLDYFENISGGIKKPDIKGALEGKPLIPPTASEAWRSKVEEGLSPEEAGALRKSEFEGMVAIDLLMGGLGGAKVTPEAAAKGKSAPANPIQRKINKLDAVLRSGAGEGEKAAALAAKNRLTGKYDIGKGVEKIAKKEGISVSDTLGRIWEATKKWGKKKFGREPTTTNAKFEEVEKFLENIQTAEGKGLAKIEPQPVISPRFKLEAPKKVEVPKEAELSIKEKFIRELPSPILKLPKKPQQEIENIALNWDVIPQKFPKKKHSPEIEKTKLGILNEMKEIRPDFSGKDIQNAKFILDRMPNEFFEMDGRSQLFTPIIAAKKADYFKEGMPRPEVSKPPPPTPPSAGGPPEPPKPPIQEVMEKDSLSQALLKDNRVTQVLSNIANKFDIERPFVKAGAPETGFRVKTYHVEINKNIDQGKLVQKEIKKLKLSKEEMGDLVLASELKKRPKDPKLAKAYDITTKYYETSLAELKKAGVLKGGFIENQIDNIRDEIEQKTIDLKKKGITTQQIRNRAVELEDLKNELDELKEMRFVSIPSALWFENKALMDPATFKRVLKFQTNRRRKTLRIKDLVDKGVIKKDDLNMPEIIDMYSRKKGRDLALANIMNAAKTEGLASLEPKKNFVKIPGYVAPELAKYWIHPAFADYISVYTQPVPMNWYDKLASVSKGYRFYNPIFIPMYNIFQQAPAFLLNPKIWPKLPRICKKTIQGYFNKTPDYWRAYEDGTFSNIFVPESAILQDYAKKLPPTQSSPGIEVVKKIAKMPKKIHDKFYDASQGLTWGIDQIQRYATRNLFIEMGMSPRKAAQKAANLHADYAKMPPKTRRQFNRALITPTFQALMIRLPFYLLKDSYKVGRAILKGEKVKVEDRVGLEYLLGVLAILTAYDQYMRSKDFKAKIWGYSYTRPDPEDPTREQVVTFSNPYNVLPKWADILGSPFFDKSEDRMFWNVLRRVKFRSAVPVQIAWELVENKKFNGDLIVRPGDNPVVKVGKIMDHVAGKIFALYGDFIKQERIGDPVAQELLKEDFGKLISSLPLFYTYMRGGEAARIYNRKAQIEKKMLNELYRLQRQGKEMSEEEKEKWRKAIREVK